MNEMKLKNLKISLMTLLIISLSLSLTSFLSPILLQKTPLTEEKLFNLKISDPNAFISVWNTTLTSSGSSSSNQVKLPLIFSGTYNFLIKWGDGNQDTITS